MDTIGRINLDQSKQKLHTSSCYRHMFNHHINYTITSQCRFGDTTYKKILNAHQNFHIVQERRGIETSSKKITQ